MTLSTSHAGGQTILAADINAIAALVNTHETDKLNTAAAPELIRDTIGTALVAGANVTITVDDAGDTITIAGDVGAVQASTLVNSWANFDATTYDSAGYSLENGRVFLCGLLQGGANNTTIFTLPAGYRPQYRSVHTCVAYVGGAANLATVFVYQTGNVDLVTLPAGTLTWLSLSDISFRQYA